MKLNLFLTASLLFLFNCQIFESVGSISTSVTGVSTSLNSISKLSDSVQSISGSLQSISGSSSGGGQGVKLPSGVGSSSRSSVLPSPQAML